MGFAGLLFLLVLRWEVFFFSDPGYFLPFYLCRWSWLNKTGLQNN